MTNPIDFFKVQEKLDGSSWKHVSKNLFVISSTSIIGEYEWKHVSVSKRDIKGRMVDVSWEEICEIKEKFIGDKYAYMVFPPKDKYVNIAHVFHLWQRTVSDMVLPEFSALIPGIGRSI